MIRKTKISPVAARGSDGFGWLQVDDSDVTSSGDAGFSTEVGSIAEQINEWLSSDADVLLNLRHKAYTNDLIAMNGHDRSSSIRMLHNYMTTSPSNNIEADFP